MSLQLTLVEDRMLKQTLGFVPLMVHEITLKPQVNKTALHRLYRLSTLWTPGVAQQMRPDSPHTRIIIFQPFLTHVNGLFYSFVISPPPHASLDSDPAKDKKRIPITRAKARLHLLLVAGRWNARLT